MKCCSKKVVYRTQDRLQLLVINAQSGNPVKGTQRTFDNVINTQYVLQATIWEPMSYRV